ncbi:MAG: hypothetical protein AB1634_14485, partial [Thermodesulfobacteriota bacterium]
PWSTRLLSIKTQAGAETVQWKEYLYTRTSDIAQITDKKTSATFYFGKIFEVTSLGTETRYIFAGSLRVAKVENGLPMYFAKDHLGSTAATLSGLSVIESSEYLPFGQERSHTGSVEESHKFTDQELAPAGTRQSRLPSRVEVPVEFWPVGGTC